MRKRKSKSKVAIVVVILLFIVIGAGVGVFFLMKNDNIKYLNVKIHESSGELIFNTDHLKLAPNSEILKMPVTVSLNNDSENAFIRAKIIYISNSEDDRVLSFVNQLNKDIKNVTTFSNENYNWQYFEEDNSFYLLNNDVLKVVTKNDYNHYFLNSLKVPSTLSQVSSLNDEGNNVQIGEEIELKIVFEAIQTVGILNGGNPTIENVREHFNNFSVHNENGFTSVNGFITKYTGTDANLILPKYVGEDYILGVKKDAFVNNVTQKLVIPGSYFKFDNFAFSALSSLNYVNIKSSMPITLSESTFSANSSLEIYVPQDNVNYVKQTYINFPYVNNIKTYNEVISGNISSMNNDVTVIYAPHVEEFIGTFENFKNLKLLIAPSLKTINENMFKGLTNLVEVDTPNVTTINNGAFNNCSNLFKVSFSKNLSSIGEQSFMNCKNITNINFAKNLQEIKRETFRGCARISNVIFTNENLSVGDGAFYQCGGLKLVELNNLNSLGEHSFAYCTAIKYFKINTFTNMSFNSNSFTNVNNALFVLSNSQDKTNFIGYNETFANKTVLLEISNNVLTNYEGTIKNLNLSEISLINKITKIGSEAFKDNESLNSLTLPETVKELDAEFISGCVNLTSLTLNSNLPPKTNENSFININSNLIIYVPTNSLELYKQTYESYNLTIIEK